MTYLTNRGRHLYEETDAPGDTLVKPVCGNSKASVYVSRLQTTEFPDDHPLLCGNCRRIARLARA